MSVLPIYDAGRSFDMTTLTANYQSVGDVLDGPAIGFVILNTSDVDAQLSFDDGSNDGPIIVAGGELDSSRFVNDLKFHGKEVLPKGARLAVKWIDGVAGSDGKLIFNVAR